MNVLLHIQNFECNVAPLCTETNCEPSEQKKEVETRIGPDGSTEIVLTPQQEDKDKDFKDIEFKDPLKKPLALDDGRWAVICWYA